LDQSFYHFSEDARSLLYDLGLDILSNPSGYKDSPPKAEWMEQVGANFLKNRLEKWEDFFGREGASGFSRVLRLRCQYGALLDYFHEKTSSECWGAEMTHSCRRYVQDGKPHIKLPEGGLAARIELDIPAEVQFDLIVCFHTLTHSISLLDDLKVIRQWLKPGGFVIFCDEISKKYHNPFHMLHMDESSLVAILGESGFERVIRLDGCGNAESNTTKYTEKGDNPDIVATVS